ncbi:MAG: hypothetical protein KC620_09430 [Myxococcales bacterium]|nr:hypothetical protein [Myxococcales bacterium]
MPDAAPDAGEAPSDPCDPLDPAQCVLPWPSNLYLTPDPTRDSGDVVDFPPGALPVSITGVPIDGRLLRRADGYGVGTPMLAVFPHLDASRLPSEGNIAPSLAEDSPIGLFEVHPDGLVRLPCFAEPDARDHDDARRTLIVRPAVLLRENTRYLIAFRGLVDTDGAAIPPSAAFAALRDGTAADDAKLAPRQAAFEDIFALLETAGFARASLTLAWDFHTASHASMHGRLLHMRDEALATVGPLGPELTVNSVETFTPEQDPDLAVRIIGTAHVPHYMHQSDESFLGYSGYEFNLGEDGLPEQNGWRDAEFVVLVPHSALNGDPVGLIQYGHGLNASWRQADARQHLQTANRQGYIYFAASMIGMSSEDVDGIIGILYDLNRFPWLIDRLHQGMLEWTLIARAMKHRLADLPEIRDRGIVIDGDRLFYEGDSQGGIYGATHMAISPDVMRGMLGVPGQNYSILLQRSVDFDPFFLILDGVYQDRRDQQVLLGMMGVLWDSIDSSGQYRHIVAEPHPGTPAKQVLLGPARGDYQVSPLTVEIAARSDIGIGLMENYDDERTPELIEQTPYPHRGSAAVLWHFGNPWPPPGNHPPVEDELGDPHGRPRREPAYIEMMTTFFETGEIIDTCNGGLCPPPR